MKIKISDIKNDINMPDFPSILLIDLERESKFNTFTNLNNELPNFSKKILSSEANKLLEQLFFYANEKNEILTINTIGINTLKIPTNEFSKTMKEELRYISQFYNKFTFVISTTNYNSMELHSIAKWSEENDKLYFVSIKNEEEYNQLVLNKFNNVIVLKSSKFPYEAEAIAVDIHHMFIHSEMEDIEYPNLEISVDCADEPYIESLELDIPYSKGHIGFTYEERVGLEIIPKLLEQMELVSGLPEKLSEYLIRIRRCNYE